MADLQSTEEPGSLKRPGHMDTIVNGTVAQTNSVKTNFDGNVEGPSPFPMGEGQRPLSASVIGPPESQTNSVNINFDGDIAGPSPFPTEERQRPLSASVVGPPGGLLQSLTTNPCLPIQHCWNSWQGSGWSNDDRRTPGPKPLPAPSTGLSPFSPLPTPGGRLR